MRLRPVVPGFVLPRLLVGLAASAAPAVAQVDARLLRYPDVSATQIAFVYGGDIWTVPKAGGLATRLSSPRGEETWPRFSPDGSRIAFSGNYDGNVDLYTVPASGGEATRITHHPVPDRMMDWYPDGKSLLFASMMASERFRYFQLHRVAATGGLPERLPTRVAEYGAISPDGKTLAFTEFAPMTGSPRDWKGYRGGSSPDIWLFDLATFEARNVTKSAANDVYPMWRGRTLYFLSDREPRTRYNIWAYDVDRGTLRQVTRFTDDDITFPAIGPSDIVFQAGGKLYLLDLATEQTKEVRVQVVTDLASVRPRTEKVAGLIQNAGISPTGQRVAFEARGEIFTVPAENGPVQNLTQSSGVAERSPAWSPDGRQVAYWSDRSGEYQLMIRPADGGAERTVTAYGAGFRYRPFWSPNGEKLAFVDQTMTIRIFEVASGKTTTVDRGEYLHHGQLTAFTPSWSPDSRWLAYTRDIGPGARPGADGAIQLFDTRTGRRHQVTSGYYADYAPTFDPDGKYLFFLSARTFTPAYADIDNTWIYPNASNLVAVPLRSEVPSPLAPRNDVENAPKDTTRAATPPAVEIELADFERRLVVLPPPAGNFAGLQAVSGKVLYHRRPRTGAGRGEKSPIGYYDLKERTEQTVLDDADGFQVSADGKKLLAAKDRRFAIVDVKPGQKLDKLLRVDDLEMTVDPRAEWRQILTDVGRIHRDYFYDSTLHAVNWEAMRTRYGRLLEGAVSRWDLDFVIGELIGELRSGHTYRAGGDVETGPQRPVGLLGVDWSVENGAYRIKRIIDGADWDSEVRSPLRRIVREGEYVLAVNGTPLDPARDPWAGFDGLAGKAVELTVNDRPVADGARKVLVETLADESRLRHLQWVESNRKRVEEATGGRVGYIYVPSTGVDGQTELVRQYRAQQEKDALIVDERWNTGGQIPDRFIELLNRPALAFWAVRDGKDWRWPPAGHFGPKVMLINGWSGSGGDAFPFFFKEAKLGPLIGERTWGALIGLSGNPTLMDGGTITVPTFRMYSVRGEWFPEGHGVDPDIEIGLDPGQLARGRDSQLERGIEEIVRLLKERPPVTPRRPRWEDRTAKPE